MLLMRRAVRLRGLLGLASEAAGTELAGTSTSSSSTPGAASAAVPWMLALARGVRKAANQVRMGRCHLVIAAPHPAAWS